MIDTKPVPARDLFHQAEIAFRRRDYLVCASLCEDSLRAEPDQVPVLRLLGAVRFKLEKKAEGVEALSQAMELAPRDLSLRIDYAASLSGSGNAAAAIAVLREGLRQHPYQTDLVVRVVPLLSDSGRHGEAQELLLGAIAKAPRHAELRFMLAAEFAADLRTEEALAHLLVAGDIDPHSYTLHSNMGVLYHGLGLHDSAIRAYERAFEYSPHAAQTHFNLSTSLLSLLDLERGFREMEWRLKLPNIRRPTCPVPDWTGQPLAGKRLLVSAEQGLGDMMMFARFLSRLLPLKPAEIIVECQPELSRLLAQMPGVSRVVDLESQLPAADYRISMVSLPYATGVCAIEELSETIPYLAPPPGQHFGLPEGRGLKVGLVWASRPSETYLYVRRSLNRRSCPPEVLTRALVKVPGVSFYSLQKGARPEEQALLEGLPIHDLSPRLNDLADTAAAMAELDLVISVDTSPAHLAGAMGKPAWILLAHGQVDFRWGLGEESSAWYPQSRLFRANRAGWPSLVATVAAELDALAQGRGRAWAAPIWAGEG